MKCIQAVEIPALPALEAMIVIWDDDIYGDSPVSNPTLVRNGCSFLDGWDTRGINVVEPPVATPISQGIISRLRCAPRLALLELKNFACGSAAAFASIEAFRSSGTTSTTQNLDSSFAPLLTASMNTRTYASALPGCPVWMNSTRFCLSDTVIWSDATDYTGDMSQYTYSMLHLRQQSWRETARLEDGKWKRRQLGGKFFGDGRR